MSTFDTQPLRNSIAEGFGKLSALQGILPSDDIKERRTHLWTALELVEAMEVGSANLGAIIDLAVSAALDGIDRPDRLAAAYEVAGIARDIADRAEHLANAEAIFESDMTDEQVRELVNDIRGVQLGMDFG